MKIFSWLLRTAKQRRLVDEIREIGARHSRRAARQRRDVHVVGDGLVAQMDLENSLTASEIRCVDDDLPVEAAGAQKRGVEHVGPVGGRDENHAVVRLEPVHLDEQLVERLLSLVVTAAKACTPVPAYGINLVDEDDTWRVCFPLLEEVADAARADADEHLDEVGTRHREERTRGLAGDRLRQQRLAGARRTDEQRALRQASAEFRELLRVAQELDDLLQLLLGFVGAGHVGEGDLGGVAREQLCFRFAERKRLGPARLHLLEDKQVEADDDEPGHEVHDPRRDRNAGVLRVDRDTLGVQRGDFGLRILHRETDAEVLVLLIVVGRNRDPVLEGPVHGLAGRNRHLGDVPVVQLVAILRVRDLFRRLGLRSRELDEDDGNQDQENPKGDGLGKPSPTELLLAVFRLHRKWHYRKLAMYGRCLKFSA